MQECLHRLFVHSFQVLELAALFDLQLAMQQALPCKHAWYKQVMSHADAQQLQQNENENEHAQVAVCFSRAICLHAPPGKKTERAN